MSTTPDTSGAPHLHPLSIEHIDDYLYLAQLTYYTERDGNPLLPHIPEDVIDGPVRERLTALVDNGCGAEVVVDGNVDAFMAFTPPIEDIFQSGRGAISPLYANCVRSRSMELTFPMLFRVVARQLGELGVRTIAITTCSHDFIKHYLVRYGFGIRCADAMIDDAKVPTTMTKSGVTFKQLSMDDASELLELANGLVDHLGEAPIFLRYDHFTAESFVERSRQRASTFYVAYAEGRPISYLEVCDMGENYMSHYTALRNIHGAYTVPEWRGEGIMRRLLRRALNANTQFGTPLLGVDYETMNPKAGEFWPSVGIEYTHSWVRRIDDTRVRG